MAAPVACPVNQPGLFLVPKKFVMGERIFSELAVKHFWQTGDGR
jgi:hypothetical protein